MSVALGGDLSHAFSFQDDAVGVVDEAVEDGVGEGGIADDLVPVFDRDLAGDDGGAAAVAILDDFEQVAALLGGQRIEPPIIEDEQLDAGDAESGRSGRRRGRARALRSSRGSR